MMGQYVPTLPLISTVSEEGMLQWAATSIQPAPASSAVTTVANEARYFPLRLSAPFLIVKFWWINGTAVAGNIDAGIYSASGTLLTSIGSTAQATTSAVQSVTLGTPYLLMPDFYYLAWCASSTSATMFMQLSTNGVTDARRVGMYTQTSAFPLPATATFAAASTSRIAVVGISNRTTV